MFLLVLIISFSSYRQTNEVLSAESPVYEIPALSTYIIEHTNPDDAIIDEAKILAITLNTGRPTIKKDLLPTDRVRQMIKNIGFKNTMDHYRIKYLVTRHEPDYLSWASLFAETNIGNSTIEREDIINAILNDQNEFNNTAVRNQVIQELNVPTKFKLEKKIGPYNLYTFQD